MPESFDAMHALFFENLSPIEPVPINGVCTFLFLHEGWGWIPKYVS